MDSVGFMWTLKEETKLIHHILAQSDLKQYKWISVIVQV